MAKAKKTYRLDEETVAIIAAVAERDGVTATEVVEAAVRAYADASISGSDQASQEAAPPVDAAIAALSAQLEAKDEQIDALMTSLASSLANAQKLADQAQRLQAAALPPASVPLKPPRLTLRERITGHVSSRI